MSKSPSVFVTRGASKALMDAGEGWFHYYQRHINGDWGDCCPEDKETNDANRINGGQLLSSFKLRTGAALWVITDAADEQGVRHAVTILTPEEY